MNDLQLNIQMRQQFLALPHHPLRMTRLAEIEITAHLMYFDIAGSDQQLNLEKIKQCEARFVRFCKDQWQSKN
jgi:hypothetical protein